MSADHIPQADSLQRLRAFVAFVVERGTVPAADAGKAAGLSPRHTAYYRDAAECLGLVRPAADEVEATDAARRLLATAPDSLAEARAFRRLISASRAIARVAPGLMGSEPPTRESIARAIGEQTGLSPSVAERRAACLWRWRRQVIGREHPQLELFGADVLDLVPPSKA
jgi:hypothetical protein